MSFDAFTITGIFFTVVAFAFFFATCKGGCKVES